jgi:predicted RND superfamily exporter protein|tara:strand:+ start:333 stop:3317 length:2985 start_codon:yes stop_codon:yes gene_type:complete
MLTNLGLVRQSSGFKKPTMNSLGRAIMICTKSVKITLETEIEHPMTSQTISNNKFTTRLAARLERNSRRVIAGALVLTALLTIPYFLLVPDTEASQDPSGEVFDIRDDIDERFESEIHGTSWLFESRTDDILTRDGLLEVLDNSRALRDADRRGELSPERLPEQPYLITRLDPDTGRSISGIDTLADAVDEVFRADPRLAPSLAEATDEQVKIVIHNLFSDQRSSGLREAISVRATSEQRTVLDQEIIWWTAPAIISFSLADNQKLGGGTQQIGLGADDTVIDKEEFNRNVQEILRGEQVHNQVWGIGIDVSLESADQGAVAGTFIMFTVIGAIIVIGISLRSYWAMALTGAGLGILMVWLKGLSNLIGLEGGLIIELIVPVAMIALGIDFAVHALKRYEEEKLLGFEPREAFVVGLGGVLGALALAFASDGLAFLSNTSSGIESVVHFGIAAAIAVASSFFVLGVIVPLAMMEIDLIRAGRPGRAGRFARIGTVFFSIDVAVLSGVAVVFTVARGVIPNGLELVILATTIGLHLLLPLYIVSRRPVVTVGDAESRPHIAKKAANGLLVVVVTALARWRYIVLPAALGITVLSGIFASRLEASFDVKDFFSSDADFVVSLDKTDEHIGDRAGEFAIIYLQGDFTDPTAIATTDQFINNLGKNSYVARGTTGKPDVTQSVVSITRRITSSDRSRSLAEELTGVVIVDANEDGLPDDRTGQKAVLDYAISVGVPLDEETLVMTASQVREIIDYRDGSEVQTTIFMVGIPGTRRQEVVKAASEALESDLVIFDESDAVTVSELTGSPFTRQAQLEATTEALQRSIPIAAIGALVLLLLVMRSIRYAVVTVIPIGLVVAWLYAIMYIGGFAFNFVTATIGAVSIGVGIDFSIHMTERFREELGRASSRGDALARATKGTGVALAASAASSIVGFVILGLAPMPLFSSYGFLTAIMIAVALAASLFVLPSLLVLVTPDFARKPVAESALGEITLESPGN